MSGKPTDEEHYFGAYASYCEGVAADIHTSTLYTCPTQYPIIEIENYFNGLFQ